MVTNIKGTVQLGVTAMTCAKVPGVVGKNSFNLPDPVCVCGGSMNHTLKTVALLRQTTQYGLQKVGGRLLYCHQYHLLRDWG